MKISTIETRLSTRYEEHDPEQDGNKNTKFADIIIDGRSFYQRMKKNHDLVPCLGWGSDDYQKLLLDYFLLRTPHEFMYDRYPILVCPWCGDEECGYISVKIDRKDDIVIWKDFMLDDQKLQVGPFCFEWERYEQAILNTFGMAGIQ
ncbi:oxidoreductase [Paenibacillus silvae]|uniref:oxidoreductase n=1 Tax=Paenibacillus silvae TaxID=1325358 RepID=UPI0011AAEC7C|nr:MULTISPECIES: oxidoreductase [Paenibacillus]MCK6074626.1 oxidoreductase [Paenibacillus silvae]MCK6147899.1 oxidoreductase [Paenibacillus silvae]MCK6266197.1 oxidoreductase [Paenibacillus silvae]